MSPEPIERAPVAGTRQLLAHQPFRNYFAARILSELAARMTTVAVGWQVYALTSSAFALGMVGLAPFIRRPC